MEQKQTFLKEIMFQNRLASFTQEIFQENLKFKSEKSKSLNLNLSTKKKLLEKIILKRNKNKNKNSLKQIEDDLNEKITKSQEKSFFYQRFNEINSIDFFFRIMQDYRTKNVDEKQKLRSDFEKKMNKLNIMQKDKQEYVSTHSSPIRLPNSASLFKNDYLKSALSQNIEIHSPEKNEKNEKITSHSISRIKNNINLEVNNSKNKRKSIKLRAVSAYSPNESTKRKNYSDLTKKYYRMKDLNQGIAFAMTIPELKNKKNTMEDNLLKGVLKDSKELNIYIDKMIRNLLAKRNKKSNDLQNENIPIDNEKKIIQNLKINTEKNIGKGINKIEKMLNIDSSTLKYSSGSPLINRSASPINKKKIELRSKIMKKYNILEKATKNIQLIKFYRNKISNGNTRIKIVDYFN